MPASCLIAMRPDSSHRRAALPLWLAALTIVAVPVLAQLPPRTGGVLADNSQRVLPIDEAFPWRLSEAAPGQFRITFTPAPEHYLYAHAFAFRLGSGGEERALEFDLPPGLEKHDRFFGDVVAYYDPVAVEFDFTDDHAAGSTLLIEYQGCADWGFCYPPQRAQFELPAR